MKLNKMDIHPGGDTGGEVDWKEVAIFFMQECGGVAAKLAGVQYGTGIIQTFLDKKLMDF